jgi:hypothetical protein
VTHHARYSTLEILLKAVKPQQARADSYSRGNDRDAIEFLLKSLDESLLRTLISLIPKEKQSFVSLWFVLVDLNQKHTVSYLDTFKAEIRAIVPGNFPGENISEFVTAVLSKFVVLKNAMSVDHYLTILNLLKVGRPTTTENYGRQLFSGEIADFSKKHARALPGIHHLSLADKDAKMKELKLTLRDLCTLPTEEYSKWIGSNSWELAGRVSDTRTVPARYASASANVLEQNITVFWSHVLQLRQARPLRPRLPPERQPRWIRRPPIPWSRGAGARPTPRSRWRSRPWQRWRSRPRARTRSWKGTQERQGLASRSSWSRTA